MTYISVRKLLLKNGCMYIFQLFTLMQDTHSVMLWRQIIYVSGHIHGLEP